MSIEERVQLAERALAASPAYCSAWRAFRAWCRDREHAELPAAPDTLLAYVVHRFRAERRAAATLDVAVHAIIKAHEAAKLPNPASPELRALLIEARSRAPRATSSIALDDMRTVARACGEDIRGLRDRTLLLCVFHGRLSRVSAVRLHIEHLDRPVFAALRVHHAEPLLCPARALERWLAARGNPSHGPLFVSVHGGHFGTQLYPGDVYRVLKRRCAEAGIPRLSSRAFRRPSIPSASKEPCR